MQLSREGEGEEVLANHLKSPADVLAHILQSSKISKSATEILSSVDARLKALETQSELPTPALEIALKQEHWKLSQEVKEEIGHLTERVSPLEGIYKTVVSSSTKVRSNVEVVQKALEQMNRKSKQHEVLIKEFKTKLEQKIGRERDTTGVGDSGQAIGRVRNVERRYEDLERQVASLKLSVNKLEFHIQASLSSTYNGVFLWRIPEVARRKRDAIEEKITSIYSPPFYTDQTGYKMCVRVYLNGDGMGYKTHLSIYFVLMKGEFDSLLQWPFEHKVSFILVDQTHRKHIVQAFKPTVGSDSFCQPVMDMNVASGCPQFAKLAVLEDKNYVKDDAMFIKCIIDTSKIFGHP